MKSEVIRIIVSHSITCTLVKMGRGDYCLMQTDPKPIQYANHRSTGVRFGNKSEIEQDIKHFERFGALPHSKGEGWA